MDKQPPKSNQTLDVDRLLKQVGPRTQPNVKQAANSKAKVRQHWQQAVLKQQQIQQRRRVNWAIAASLMLMATATLFTFNQSTVNDEPMMFANLSNFSGDVQVRDALDDSWRAVQANQTIQSGTAIKTNSSNSYLTMQLNDNSEIRMAGNTELVINPQQLELTKGQIYHDTDESFKAAPLVIKTNHGYVQHIGTRYMVSNDQNATRVAVRSGQVKLTSIDSNQTQTDQTLEQNQLATLSNNNPVTLSAISAHDNLWNWTFMAQNTFSLDNKSLYEFVDWYTQQTGLAVDWQGLESPSKRVRLQGNIKNMTAEQAIQTVFYSTQYNYSINDGVLQINKQ